MYLSTRQLRTVKNVINMPEYHRRAYDGITIGYSLPGIKRLVPIFVVYQNKKNKDDVLVELHAEIYKTHEQIVFSKEFLTKFFSDTELAKHFVEKNGRMFISGFAIPNYHHFRPSFYVTEKTWACDKFNEYGHELAIAVTHKTVDHIKKASRVKELLTMVNEFKQQMDSDSFENRTIRSAQENIKSLHEDIAYWDMQTNRCCQEMEEDKAIFDKYDINWKNFIKD